VTNDWFCGLVSGYHYEKHFGDFFNKTIFFHLVHNLSRGYEEKIYSKENLYHIHSLPSELLLDDNGTALNPSKCALLLSD